MFNSIGPLTFLALVLVFIATFVAGLLIGFKTCRSDKDHSFGFGEWFTMVVDFLLVVGAVFFALNGDSVGAVVFGWLAAFTTGAVWGLTKCDFGHVRMM
jgi:hypothetical protein